MTDAAKVANMTLFALLKVAKVDTVILGKVAY